MRAMILAAGRGQRMRPLTDKTPKPLLKVAGKALIEYHLEKLHTAGVTEVVINTAWLGKKLESFLGDGSKYGVAIHWSHEAEGGLETAGGIIRALSLLGEEPFWVINGDVWTDIDFSCLPKTLGNDLGHLILVSNPSHHPDGDFALSGNRVVNDVKASRYTFSGISLLSPQLFNGNYPPRIALKPFLLDAISQGRLAGTLFDGCWTDVGTPQRLTALSQHLAADHRRGGRHVG